MVNNIKQIIVTGLIIGLIYLGFSKRQESIQQEEMIDKITQPDLSQEDQVRIFYAILMECSVCPEEEQMAVAKTVLNRVEDDRFPNTVKGVLNQRGAFHGVNAYDMQKYVDTYIAVSNAINDTRDKRIVGYYNPKTSTNKKWIKKMSGNTILKHRFHIFHSI